jgi:hypothetical protein
MTATGELRRAEPGEMCPCGRPAVKVYLAGRYGPLGYCGKPDGGTRVVPCPWCGDVVPHLTSWGAPTRCPGYTLHVPASAEGARP